MGFYCNHMNLSGCSGCCHCFLNWGLKGRVPQFRSAQGEREVIPAKGPGGKLQLITCGARYLLILDILYGILNWVGSQWTALDRELRSTCSIASCTSAVDQTGGCAFDTLVSVTKCIWLRLRKTRTAAAHSSSATLASYLPLLNMYLISALDWLCASNIGIVSLYRPTHASLTISFPGSHL